MSRKPTGTLFYRICKRTFDIAFSAGCTAVLAIPMAGVCAAICVESPGCPVYTQERVGRGGRVIRVLKLRSMVPDANDVRKYLSPEQLHQWEVERKVDDDPRITKVGQFIRKFSIDEVPQFLNVLKGDLSVIGPRPITRDELEQACGRPPTATPRPSRAACARRSSSSPCGTAASAWTGNVSPAPSVPCLGKGGPGDDEGFPCDSDPQC